MRINRWVCFHHMCMNHSNIVFHVCTCMFIYIHVYVNNLIVYLLFLILYDHCIISFGTIDKTKYNNQKYYKCMCHSYFQSIGLSFIA